MNPTGTRTLSPVETHMAAVREAERKLEWCINNTSSGETYRAVVINEVREAQARLITALTVSINYAIERGIEGEAVEGIDSLIDAMPGVQA